MGRNVTNRVVRPRQSLDSYMSSQFLEPVVDGIGLERRRNPCDWFGPRGRGIPALLKARVLILPSPFNAAPAMRHPLAHNGLYFLLGNKQKCTKAYLLRSRRKKESPPCPCYPPAPFSPRPLFVTLADRQEPTENPATLSPFPVTLTNRVNPNPLVSHSFKKHPGVG